MPSTLRYTIRAEALESHPQVTTRRPWQLAYPAGEAPQEWTADEKQALRAHERQRLARSTVMLMSLALGAGVMWLPLTRLLSGAVSGLALAVTAAMVLPALVRGLPLGRGLVDDHPLPFCALAGASLVFAVGWALGRSVGPFAFGFIYALPPLTIALALTTRARIAVTLGVAAVGWSAFVLATPAVREANLFLATSSFLLFCALFGIAMGHIAYRIAAVHFIRRFRIGVQQAELQSLTEQLDARSLRHDQELRILANYLDGLNETEAAWMSTELRDHLGPEFDLLDGALERARWRLYGNRDLARAALEECETLSRRTRRAFRRLLEQLHPRMLEHLGLETALGWLVGEAALSGALAISISTELPDELPPSVSAAAYAVVLDALQVVAGRAATTAEVTLSWSEAGVSIAIHDDAEPLAGDVPPLLLAIRERATSLGGRAAWSDRQPGLALGVVLPVGTP